MTSSLFSDVAAASCRSHLGGARDGLAEYRGFLASVGLLAEGRFDVEISSAVGRAALHRISSGITDAALYLGASQMAEDAVSEVGLALRDIDGVLRGKSSIRSLALGQSREERLSDILMSLDAAMRDHYRVPLPAAPAMRN